ncbi:MAG: hypothetical protein ACE5GD_03290 [Candidatus Geothermarchaeales archaeon]
MVVLLRKAFTVYCMGRDVPNVYELRSGRIGRVEPIFAESYLPCSIR